MKTHPLFNQCLAETLGTFILVFFGVGAVHAAVLTGAQSGIWQVAVVWALAISLAIYAVGAVSGAHINPAMTIAFALYRGFPKRRIAPFILSQLLGAFLAAAVLYGLFQGTITHFETANNIVRGAAGSEASAMVFGEYFPNPGTAKAMGWGPEAVPFVTAMLAEAIGTLFLAFFVFAVTDARNAGGPGEKILPIMIGLTVAMCISVIAPLTQAGFNPARDFGPRLFAWFAGWGTIAIPGPRGGFFAVYILSPILGAAVGGALYQYVCSSRIKFSLRNRQRLNEAADLWGAKPTADTGYGISTYERKKMNTKLIFVGGFLGAGKTTLLWEAARELAAQGEPVGLITNDQAPELVDSTLLTRTGANIAEVSGSCFCCNFNGLTGAIESLIARGAKTIIAEPVGSCTDLSATIMQPLKKFHPDWNLAPLTVLVDPNRLPEILGTRSSLVEADALYIMRLQLEEADMILLSKGDTIFEAAGKDAIDLIQKTFPGKPVAQIAAQSGGQGVANWLGTLEKSLQSGGVSGKTIAPVDYDRYAHGEAVLGWLNATVSLAVPKGKEADAGRYVQRLLEALQKELNSLNAEIGHLKAIAALNGRTAVGNLTQLQGNISVRNLGDTAGESVLTLNARVQIAPERLEEIVRKTIDQTNDGLETKILTLRCLMPGRPNPTHRFSEVV